MSTAKKPAPHEAPAAAAATAPEPVKVGAFAIFDNIPIPESRTGGNKESAYPFKVLEIGQSFFVPPTDKMQDPTKSMSSLASRQSRELFPRQFKTANVEHEGVKGVMIWRVADAVGEKPIPKKRTPKATATAENAPPPPPAPGTFAPPAPPAA